MRTNPPPRARYDYEQNWPADVWSIGLDRVDLLGVDLDGHLYWNGQPLEIRKSVDLSFWQKLGAIILTVSTALAAGAASVSAYVDIAKP